MHSAWQGPLPHAGSQGALEHWWARFDDPVLSRLIRQAEDGSPSLAKAAARIQGARALVASSNAAQGPSINSTASVSSTRQGPTALQTGLSGQYSSRNLGFDASWEIDMFGKLRKAREAALARVDARIDDWHDARVSLAAEVADNYVQLLGCRLLAQAFHAESTSQAETERMMQASVSAGLTATADGALAVAGAASARNNEVSQRTQCEVISQSLVALTGSDQNDLNALFAMQTTSLRDPVGVNVLSVPADWLRQRPDLASSERALAAAYADVGQADADRYPSFSLGGSITRAATGAVPTGNGWSFGPSLSVPLFDAGKRKAAVASAQATYDEALATYRVSVRTAVKEVEQALLNLDGAARRSRDAGRAAESYRQYFSSTEANWRAGNVSLLSLEEARRSAIEAASTQITLQRDRLRYWIALYKALGGGWSADSTLGSRDAPAEMSKSTSISENFAFITSSLKPITK